jgi:hypothetical protein
MLLIGTSLSRCMSSIARNEVKIGDILFIISNTRTTNYAAFMKLINTYMQFIDPDEHDRVRLVASYLYKSGRIHQHRLFNDPTPEALQKEMEVNQKELDAIGEENLSLSPLEQPEIVHSEAWLHIAPTNQNSTPAVVAAYEHYKLLDALTKN